MENPNLYMCGILTTSTELPCLYVQNAISERYHLPARQIKVYVHYQPSFYHFHVHYVHILLDDPGGVVGHAHLLEDVIDNIEHISSHYYQDCTFTYALRKEDKLWKMMEETAHTE